MLPLAWQLVWKKKYCLQPLLIFVESDRPNQWPDRWEDSHVLFLVYKVRGMPVCHSHLQSQTTVHCCLHVKVMRARSYLFPFSLSCGWSPMEFPWCNMLQGNKVPQLVPVEHGDSPRCVATRRHTTNMSYGTTNISDTGILGEPWGIYAAASNAAPKPPRIFWD